jgi:hypothetical protein
MLFYSLQTKLYFRNKCYMYLDDLLPTSFHDPKLNSPHVAPNVTTDCGKLEYTSLGRPPMTHVHMTVNKNVSTKDLEREHASRSCVDSNLQCQRFFFFAYGLPHCALTTYRRNVEWLIINWKGCRRKQLRPKQAVKANRSVRCRGSHI